VRVVYVFIWRECVFSYEVRTLLRLGVSQCRTLTQHRHLQLHWIMSFSQIIINVDVSVSVPVYVSVTCHLFTFFWVCKLCTNFVFVMFLHFVFHLYCSVAGGFCRLVLLPSSYTLVCIFNVFYPLNSIKLPTCFVV
jgi:hypothetical protein